MLIKDISVPSTDGKTTLKGRLFLPEGEPAGTVQIVHGMAEHITRYEPFMTRLCEAGYIVFGHDQVGHGDTAQASVTPGDIKALDAALGYIAPRRGWTVLLNDIDAFHRGVLEQLRNSGLDAEKLPYVLFGHSMGSFEVRLASEMFKAPDKLVVMGTGGPNPAVGAGKVLAGIIKVFCGARHISPLLNKLMFGAYNERFKNEPDGDEYSWLSTLKSTRVKYIRDKFCGFDFKTAALGDLITLTQKANSGSWFKKFDVALPTLLISGTEDPVGAYGEGVKAVYSKLIARGADVTLRLVPEERHELLNEKERDATIDEILAFIGPGKAAN